MLKMVDGTGIIGVDMVCPLGVSTPQPPNYDRVELEGTGVLVLPNSLDAPLERLELGGKTEQVQTTGKNLIDQDAIIDGKTINSSNGEVVNNTQSCITDFIHLKPETYTFSIDNVLQDVQIMIILYNDNKTFNKYLLSNKNQTSKIIIPENMYARIAFNNVKSFILSRHVMMEIGSNKTNYEPYTGGKPSPSPEYPQEILNAGRLNEDTGKYEIDVTINSGNLFKLIEHTSGYYVDKDGKVQIAKTFGYSWTAAVNNLQKQSVTLHVTTMINARYRLYCTDLQNTILYKHEDSSANTNDNSHTFNMPDGTKKIYVSVIEINSVEQAEITLNLGNVTLPYEPYKEQTLTLTSDRPITKWDRLVEQGGQIGWLYKSKVYDGFDGKNNRIELGNKVGNVQHFSVYFASTPNGVGNANSYCDKYIGVNVSWAKEKFGIFCDWNNGVKFFSAPNEKVTNLEEFKAWLIENPLGLAYETLETEFIPLPQSEQNAIRALKTYYPTTVITVDGGELDPDIKVTYRKEK